MKTFGNKIKLKQENNKARFFINFKKKEGIKHLKRYVLKGSGEKTITNLRI
jgi:hypothetical protein